MHIAFLNPQGNFDPADSYWTEHPDFGGQLVYVKQVALALGELGHRVDIVTRRIDDALWPEFAARFDAYPDASNVRIVRLDAGPPGFLAKEDLWSHVAADWVPAILEFYEQEGRRPDATTGHYGDGGIAAALLRRAAGIPFTFTAHSLGAQKIDKLLSDTATSVSVHPRYRVAAALVRRAARLPVTFTARLLGSHRLNKLPIGAAELESYDARFRFGRRLVAERIAMSHAGVVIASTLQERMEQYSHPAYRRAVDVDDDSRFAVVPPGVNLNLFDRDAWSPYAEAEAARVDAALGSLPPDRAGLPVVVASSRLDPKKNHAVLAEAFAASPELRQRANLLILTGRYEDPLRHPEALTGDERAVIDRLRAIVDRSDLGELVVTLAVQGQERLAAVYRHLARRRSVFALTALYEPFGLAPLEAAAAGLPVVVTRNGGPSESLQEGDTRYGVLVDPESPDAVAAGILAALAEWDELAAAGRDRVLDRFTWDRTAEGYVAAIKRAQRSSSRRDELPIHAYFQVPAEATDVDLLELAALYASERILA